MDTKSSKKKIFSGIQPSGVITLGNYIGAIKNWSMLQDEYDCIYCVVDLHALTVRQDPKDLREQTKSLIALLTACGLDTEKNILFIQSHVSEHAELAWVLNCYTYFGELSRMTQFKDKSKKYSDNINVGLFAYPSLMAADILLYNTDLVPVGHDQKQHLELSRDIAIRFNNIYRDVFTVPEGYIPKIGAKIMSLQAPETKMSKSDENKNNYISLLDPPELIISKFKKAMTDSDKEIRYDVKNKPGVSNLLSIYAALSGSSIKSAEKEFVGIGYKEMKEAVGEKCVLTIKPIQDKYFEILKDKEFIQTTMKNGAEKAQSLAYKTLRKVYKKVGLTAKI
jgi:tryptophanyl-tRNA synthetase